MTSDLIRRSGLALALCLATALAAAAQDEYRLLPGDEVEFDILDDSEAARILTLAQDGQVRLPLIGGMAIDGLTVSEAIERIRGAYVERELLVDPQISLSVAAFRPVFVLGDVSEPGRLDYIAGMTVEQAVGLAGGPRRIAENGEERLLSEASLRGELRVLVAEITRQAAVVARLQAEIDRAGDLDRTAVPENVRELIDPGRFEDYAAVEAEILAQDREALDSERAALTERIEGLEEEDELLEARIAVQQEQLDTFTAERDQVAENVQRGLLARNALSDAERLLFGVEAPLLEARRQRAELERRISEVGRELDDLELEARRETLVQLQNARLEMERLIVRHGTAGERLFLVTSWQSERSREAFAVETRYQIRRDIDGTLQLRTASLTDMMLPGDVLLVTIQLPG